MKQRIAIPAQDERFSQIAGWLAMAGGSPIVPRTAVLSERTPEDPDVWIWKIWRN